VCGGGGGGGGVYLVVCAKTVYVYIH